MSNSYLMVDSKGLLCVDNNKNTVPIGDVLIEDFNDLILKTNLNIENFNNIKELDGFLIGSASINPTQFIEIINKIG